MSPATVRQTTRDRPRWERRLHVVPKAAPRPEPMHRDERRLRDAGGPHDRSQYQCGCGYLFEAPVTASVTCPHCGAGQAW
jgi:rubrerythrin